jgi:hypothetical protein
VVGRRMQRWALGRVGRGTHRWRGSARCRRKQRSTPGRLGAEEAGAQGHAVRGGSVGQGKSTWGEGAWGRSVGSVREGGMSWLVVLWIQVIDSLIYHLVDK